SQANAVLSALNLTRREIIGIQVNNASTAVPMPVMYRTDAVAAAPATPVVGGEQQVRASVTLQISY
ncbi:MAG: SIMPL domain-containing protein, partial [Planktothrix sp.]